MAIPCLVKCSSYQGGVPQTALQAMLTCSRRRRRASMDFLQFHEDGRAVTSRHLAGTKVPSTPIRQPVLPAT